MSTTNYGRLVSLFEQKGEQGGKLALREAFAADRSLAKNIDLGRLFTECFGWHEFVSCRAREQMAADVMSRALTEAEGAVSTSAFTNITGQIIYSMVLEAYQAEEGPFSDLIPERDSAFLDGEKIPGISEIGDEIAIREEGHPYALAGVSEDWINSPPTKDRGVIVPVTWEALFADRTQVLPDRCTAVGKWSRVNREKRAIDCAIDENVTTHRYNWKGTTIASYGDNSGSHTWDNLAATNGALADWTDIDTVEQVANAIVDPYTGEPAVINLKHLIVTKQNEKTAMRIVTATQLRVATPGYAVSGNPTQSLVNNPYSGKFEVVTSRLLGARLATDTDWFLADLSRYAAYMVNERMQVVSAPPNSYEEFHRRIVQQHRVNERGCYVVINPRFSIKSTVA